MERKRNGILAKQNKTSTNITIIELKSGGNACKNF